MRLLSGASALSSLMVIFPGTKMGFGTCPWESSAHKPQASGWSSPRAESKGKPEPQKLNIPFEIAQWETVFSNLNCLLEAKQVLSGEK